MPIEPARESYVDPAVAIDMQAGCIVYLKPGEQSVSIQGESGAIQVVDQKFRSRPWTVKIQDQYGWHVTELLQLELPVLQYTGNSSTSMVSAK